MTPMVVPIVPNIIVARHRSGGRSNDRTTRRSDRRPGYRRTCKTSRSKGANSGAAEAADNAAAYSAFARRVAAEKRQSSRHNNGQNQRLFQWKCRNKNSSLMRPLFDMIDVPALWAEFGHDTQRQANSAHR